MNVSRVLTSCGAPIANIAITLLAECPFPSAFRIHHDSSSAVTAPQGRTFINAALAYQSGIKAGYASLLLGEAGAGPMIDEEITLITALGED